MKNYLPSILVLVLLIAAASMLEITNANIFVLAVGGVIGFILCSNLSFNSNTDPITMLVVGTIIGLLLSAMALGTSAFGVTFVTATIGYLVIGAVALSTTTQ